MPVHEKITKVAMSNKRNASIVKVLGACIFVCLVFSAGFLVRGNTELLDAVGFSGLTGKDEANPGLTLSGSTNDSLSARLAEVEGVLKKDSLDSFDLDTATKKTLESFTSSVEDPYLRYYDEASYRTYLASTANPETGIGVLFGEQNGSCYAVDVLADSSAAGAGVMPGDFIESIDGVSKEKWTTPEVLSALAREDGKSVYVTWRRPATQQGSSGTTYGTNLVYTANTASNVTSSIDEGICYITIRQFTSDTSSVVRQTVTSATQNGAYAFVMDLRDVPGGYLTQAVETASLFITSGTVVKIRTNEGVTTRSADGEAITQLPLVVMVNERTIGCAEVLAAALQETGRATLVGTRTQGKGSVQVMQPLTFGGALRYTAATYITPKDAEIDGNGVVPSIEISASSSQDSVATDVALSQIRR